MSPCDPFPPTASANTKDSLPLAGSRELVSTSGGLTYERITDCPIAAHHLLANSLLTLLTSCDLLRWQVLGLAPLLVLGGRSAIHLDAGPPLCAFLHQPSPHLIYAYAYVCVHACICRGARTHAHTYIFVYTYTYTYAYMYVFRHVCISSTYIMLPRTHASQGRSRSREYFPSICDGSNSTGVPPPSPDPTGCPGCPPLGPELPPRPRPFEWPSVLPE